MNTVNINMNISVFATKDVVTKKYPVLYVIHDEDGDWQFAFSGDNFNERDIMIISLNQMVTIDPSIERIIHIPRGMIGERENLYSSWTVKKIL